jgi:hypothetical protein
VALDGVLALRNLLQRRQGNKSHIDQNKPSCCSLSVIFSWLGNQDCKPHGFIELTIKPDSNLKGYLKEMSMLQCDMAHHVLSYLCSANWANL